MIETQTHGDNHQAPHTRARILVTYFDGAMDAGASGRMAVEQMLRSLPATMLKTSLTTVRIALSSP